MTSRNIIGITFPLCMDGQCCLLTCVVMDDDDDG